MSTMLQAAVGHQQGNDHIESDTTMLSIDDDIGKIYHKRCMAMMHEYPTQVKIPIVKDSSLQPSIFLRSFSEKNTSPAHLRTLVRAKISSMALPTTTRAHRGQSRLERASFSSFA